MARQHPGFDPTHVSVVTDDGAAEISATNAAIDAVLDRARPVGIRLAEDQLADAGLVGRLGPDRQRRFRFDSADRYEPVASAFERLLGELDRSGSGQDS